jgi:hypothetical protein
MLFIRVVHSFGISRLYICVHGQCGTCLQRDVTSEDFREHFSDYGTVEDAAIVADQNGISRGFGFVTFSTTKSVEKALIVKHTFGDRIVDCKRAVPKDELRSQV